MVSHEMLSSTTNSDFSEKSFVMLYVKNVLQISIYTYRLFSQMVSHDMLLSVINSDFSQKSFVMLCEECLQISIYIYPFIFSNCVTRHVVEYDKLLFQPEIICNAVCEQCFQISIYILPLFSQIVSHDMLLSMINYYFSQKSFVMLYANNVCKYLFIFPLIFSNGVTRHVVEYDKLRFQPEIICNAVCEQCLQISIYIYPIFSQIGYQTTCCWVRWTQISARIIGNAVWRMFTNIY